MDYEAITDGATGKRYFINKDTGEATEAVTVEVPVGTVYYTPEQQKAYRKRKEREKEKGVISVWRKCKAESFFFLPTQ